MKLADRVIKRLRNPERGQRLAPVAERLGEERPFWVPHHGNPPGFCWQEGECEGQCRTSQQLLP
jgi:hypothetical protein